MSKVVQVAFELPYEDYLKLITNNYGNLYVGIRHMNGSQKGRIAKNYKTIKLDDKERANSVPAAIKNALEFAKNNKQQFVISGVIAGGAIVGLAVYEKLHKAPIDKFKSLLAKYLKEIQRKKLHEATVKALLNALDELKKDENYNEIKINLQLNDIAALVNLIQDYTIKFTAANAYKMESHFATDDALINLEYYLKAQRKVFEAA